MIEESVACGAMVPTNAQGLVGVAAGGVRQFLVAGLADLLGVLERAAALFAVHACILVVPANAQQGRRTLHVVWAAAQFLAQDLYLMLHPYGAVVAVEIGLPASASASPTFT